MIPFQKKHKDRERNPTSERHLWQISQKKRADLAENANFGPDTQKIPCARQSRREPFFESKSRKKLAAALGYAKRRTEDINPRTQKREEDTASTLENPAIKFLSLRQKARIAGPGGVCRGLP